MRVRYLPVALGWMYGIDQFPNFHTSGSVKGMRKQYLGKEAMLVKCGQWIYHVTGAQGMRIWNRAH